LLEGGDQTPWIPAGILSSLVLIGAVVVREVVLRRARHRFLIDQQRLDRTLSKIPHVSNINRKRPKFTLRQNSYLLTKISEKSEAAKVLKRLSEGHLEVFEICNEYLSYTKREIRHIDVNSPRYSAVKKGRSRIKKLHKYHLFAWTEIESKAYLLEAKNVDSFEDRIGNARKALTVIDSAREFYSNDARLSESREAISEQISRMKISNQIELAEKSEFRGDIATAIAGYRDILFLLTRENLAKRDKDELAEQINIEIAKLRDLKNEKRNLT